MAVNSPVLQLSSSVRALTLAALAAGLLPLALGCGGGAGAETSVSIKREKGESGGASNGAPGDSTGSGEVAAEGFGSLKGRVVLQGSAPTLAAIIKAGSEVRDKEVCAAVDLPNERLVVGDGGGVANVFVYLPSAPAGAPAAPPSDPVKFDQKGCRFFPHALLMRTGQTVLILSDDPIAHNTHTFPKRNASFNQTIKINERDGVPLIYTKPEAQPIEVKCDFHTWMIAYHLPIDHPFAAVSGPDGSFEIKDLPAGKHTFRVWHEGCQGGYLSRNLSVTIKPNEVATLEIPYPAEKFSP